MGWRDRGIEVKTSEQVAAMRKAGLVVGRTLEVLRAAVRPGVTTAELDAIGEDTIRTAGAVPSFLGYQGFPASICASVNDEVVHGIPGDRELREGDLISLDCGAIVGGWHGDAAITVPVGEVRAELLALVADTEAALWAGIAAARPGGRVGDISAAVASRLRQAGGRYGIVEDYTGSGPRCTSRPTYPTSAGGAAAPGWCPAWRSRSSPWSPSAATRPRCWTTSGRS